MMKKKHGIKLDPHFKDLCADHSDEMDKIITSIGDILDGKTYGVGALSLQIAYLIMVNELENEYRSDALNQAIDFFKLNDERFEITIQ